jgi:ABC-2 type transport system ATP-binding protein
VQQVCDRVAIIRRGRLIESGTVAGLLRRGSYIEVQVEQPERAAEALRPLPFVERVTVDGARLSVAAPPEQGAAINRALAEAGLYAGAIVPRTSSLEEVFLELTGGGEPAAGEGGGSDAPATE